MAPFEPGQRGICPHCRVSVLFEFIEWRLVDTNGGFGQKPAIAIQGSNKAVRLNACACPSCRNIILSLRPESANSDMLAWPRQSVRPAVPAEVPADLTNDYNEAALVFDASPKASAALSRRCLQALLRTQGYNQHDLAKQIDAVLPNLPSYIAENVDAIRQIGNFSAHPMKSTASGEILDVEPGEAEWNLDVLDELFDFYYVQPARAKARRDALNAKLAEAGKPPMK